MRQYLFHKTNVFDHNLEIIIENCKQEAIERYSSSFDFEIDFHVEVQSFTLVNDELSLVLNIKDKINI